MEQLKKLILLVEYIKVNFIKVYAKQKIALSNQIEALEKAKVNPKIKALILKFNKFQKGKIEPMNHESLLQKLAL